MKIAILYICTGKYNQFFNDFYSSCESKFLKGRADKEYFVFTDDLSISNQKNVHLIERQCMGFPLDSLLRFEIFMTIKDKLLKFDYIFFFNSNALFVDSVGIELLPSNSEKLVGAEWPGKRKPFKHPMFYPYERNKNSAAYIAPYEKQPYLYYMGGLNGGEAKAYLNMISTLAQNIRRDYDAGIIARVHDEAHINKYFRAHPCKILSPEYCMPEEWITPEFTPKIIFRDKVKVDQYFNKGRSSSYGSKIKKSALIIKDALIWYLK